MLVELGKQVLTLALLLTGSYSRRGQMLDILKAVGIAIVILVASLGCRSLAGKQPIMIYAMYANALLPLLIALCMLLRPPRLRPSSWFARWVKRKLQAAASQP